MFNKNCLNVYEMLSVFIFILYSSITVYSSVFNVCPQYWREYQLSNSSQTKCIKPFYEMVGRDEAQRRCRQMGPGFDLIEIHSKFENDIIVHTLLDSEVQFRNDFNDDMLNNYKPQVWIGAKRIPFGGIKDFQYRSGCSIKDFAFWHKGQPNDQFNNEDCLYMLIDPFFMGQWADYNCETKMYYICQLVTDLNPPCNQTNFNLFQNNSETKVEIKPSKGNITQNSWDRHKNLFNPFKLINELIDRLSKHWKV